MSWWQDGSIATVLSTLISSVALLLLAYTDPKRRRAHRLEEHKKSKLHVPLLLLLLISPAYWLVQIEHYGALFMWLAAITVIGWWIALLPPEANQHMKTLLAVARRYFCKVSASRKTHQEEQL